MVRQAFDLLTHPVRCERLKGLDTRPTQLELELIGEEWRPYRSVAAQLLWHLYLGDAGRL